MCESACTLKGPTRPDGDRIALICRGGGLAPFAGRFGWKAGILAAFVHMSVVLNVGGLHGGLNLYNNGFSAGIVAMILLPIMYKLEERKENTEIKPDSNEEKIVLVKSQSA